MIDKQKRQTLLACTVGLVASALPMHASSALNRSHNVSGNKLEAFNQSDKLTGIEVTVSTLGIGSAVTTLKNHSNKAVTVTSLGEGLVEYKNGQYDLNSSLGKSGVTLKPGQRRILVAHNLNTDLAFA